MKSELEVAMSESLKTVYPYLGKHMMRPDFLPSTMVVVLFVAPKCGVVMYVGEDHNKTYSRSKKLGEWRTDWIEGVFERFEGKLVMEN